MLLCVQRASGNVNNSLAQNLPCLDAETEVQRAQQQFQWCAFADLFTSPLFVHFDVWFSVGIFSLLGTGHNSGKQAN